MREAREVSETTGRLLVGRYLVHRRIAAGGMATVHLGRLLGAAGFSRMVAIKRLHDGYARDPDFVAMLLDEARLAATIRHPNVVPTLDVVAEKNELLVVMEYVEGDSLAHLVKLASVANEPVPVAIAAAVIAQTLHGLHGAHEARDKFGVPLGIVHRDVSPQNILVGVDGAARVLDFGVAKAASRSTSTENGQLKGKTAYMAPEQLQSSGVDRRTDIFAASTVLWELLAGRRLFFADSPAGTMAKILHEPIDGPQRWVPDLPPELCMIALRGLERDPDARFQTAQEMALAIEDAIALPRAKDIGAWVARIAAPILHERAELVREIERISAPMQASSDTNPELRLAMEEAERRRIVADQSTDVGIRPSPEAIAAEWAATSSARRRVFGPDELTDLATVRSSAKVVLRPPSLSRLSLALGILGALSLVTAIVVVFWFTRSRSTVATSPPPPTATAVVTPDPPASFPPPAFTAIASASSTPPPPPAAAPSTTTVRRRTAAGKGSNGADCRVPYLVDEKGLKHFKLECL